MIVDRKTLYKEIWKEPMIRVSLRYGVSNSYLGRVCKQLNIPVPPSGHWTKVKAGQKIQPPPLPNYQKPKIKKAPKHNNIYDSFQTLDRYLMESNETKKFEQLKEEALDWELSIKIRNYIARVKSKIIHSNTPKHKKKRLLKQVKWAKEKADWLDPFISANDPILGKRHRERLFD